MAAFFRFPHRVQRCVSRELQKDEEFEAQYTIFYTFDRDAYRHKSTAISDKLHERWFGEILVFRHGQKGHGERNVVNLDPRRGDSERVIWDVVRRYVQSRRRSFFLFVNARQFRFIADYESS